ncbi:MAG: hypothetical protein WEF86_16920 [Gemmatimonadota bacterium]
MTRAVSRGPRPIVHRARTMAVAVALVASAGIATLLLAADGQDTFPHEQHTGLFPLCTGCHIGIETGDDDAYYPAPANCASCHDDVREPAVTWSGPAPRPGNLRFEHVTHAVHIDAERSTALDCATCHTQLDAPRMHVQPPIPANCFSCHAHEATDHFTDADCAACHVSLAETQLPRSRVAELPRPAAHDRPDFLAAAHGELAAASTASCSTCHVREQCMGCHVTTVAGAPIGSVLAAAGRIDVPLIAAQYPVPASHLEPGWERQHGDIASAASCGSCHTRESCTTCHEPPAPAPIAQLASADDVVAPGVVVRRGKPASHASPFFATTHGPLAATRPQSCAVCHEQNELCATCHVPGGNTPARPGDVGGATVGAAVLHAAAAVDTPAPTPRPPHPSASVRPAAAPRNASGFHPANFVVRHSAEAYGRRLECSSCHSSQLFCRDCHESVGAVSTGRLGPGFHDAEPVWLLRHGQAARQTLESCTACHTQRDCMQCHSTLGSFRVNPHGADFDADRARRANPEICSACHFGE